MEGSPLLSRVGLAGPFHNDVLQAGERYGVLVFPRRAGDVKFEMPMKSIMRMGIQLE